MSKDPLGPRSEASLQGWRAVGRHASETSAKAGEWFSGVGGAGGEGVGSACYGVWDFLLGKACLKKKHTEVLELNVHNSVHYTSMKTIYYGDGRSTPNTLETTGLCTLNR